MRSGWAMKSINELAFVGRGKSRHRPRNEPSLYGGDYPFVQTADIHNADLTIISYSQTYNEKGLEQSKLWDPGTICITNAGENTGDSAILGIRACFPDSVIGVIADDPNSDTVFLKYAIDLLKPQLRQVTRGATQDNLSLSKLLSFKFPAPPSESQKKIGEMLANYGVLIENNRRRMGLLEETAWLLYREWFIRLRFPGHEHTPITNGIPDGWAQKPLAVLCESIDYGYTASAQPEEVGPKFLRITDIVPDFIDWTAVPHCPIEEVRLDKFRLREGDIVIARTGATVGYAKRLHKRHPEAVFASYLVRLRLRHDIDNLMVGVFVESDAYKSYVQSRIGGAAQPNANAKVLAGAEVLVPPPRVQRDFREFVEPLIDQREVLQLQNQKLRKARDLLLPRLMSGEIAV